ncbi:hypothetical protein FJSC11DRAFT_3774 [Fischerella thermalis JSC-11]|uniref:Uncharacterized protein n=1 Tax=Fischerella thermalis JSC-11 TaxID=741277 RepID=G6FY25_9CYAN|nr:hypothetical protein FJSC11DRAFT_3774 [Fischerella thermalis JSC-11]
MAPCFVSWLGDWLFNIYFTNQLLTTEQAEEMTRLQVAIPRK